MDTKVVLTAEEFFRDAKPTDVLKLTEQDIKELDELSRKSDYIQNLTWSVLANKVVGAE